MLQSRQHTAASRWLVDVALRVSSEKYVFLRALRFSSVLYFVCVCVCNTFLPCAVRFILFITFFFHALRFSRVHYVFPLYIMIFLCVAYFSVYDIFFSA